jgi:PTS hybrid protein
VNTLLLVSHSDKLADGLRELLGVLAGPEVAVAAVGGTDGAGVDAASIGSILSGLLANNDDTVLVIADLGSSLFNAQTAVEVNGYEDRVVVADCPMVEGAVAAAMTLAGNGSVAQAADAAKAAWGIRKGG